MFGNGCRTQPYQPAVPQVPSSALEILNAPPWQLIEWLARTRRCLAARLFFESSEAAALEVAATSHSDWFAGITACNYMQLRLGREEADIVAEHWHIFQDGKSTTLPAGIKPEQAAGLHPLNILLEPRGPSPGRALLSSMYTALGQPRLPVPFCQATHQAGPPEP